MRIMTAASTLYRAILAGCALWLALAAGPAASQGDPVDALVQRTGAEGAAELAGLLGECGGVYAAFERIAAAQAPQLGEDYREMKNGALLAGAYLLYREHRLRMREDRPLEEFLAPVRSRAQAREAEVNAAFAAQQMEKAREMLPECARLEDLQSFLVQAWRKETGRTGQ
jgi:hypothetical protein